ncbi:MAG: hypothetical protein DHS20C18_04320 [Saprospiraceae bacterium]|nr:MAG: hypothetical protein DHS20C18_04320 [Saprospiraceae bacterium]
MKAFAVVGLAVTFILTSCDPKPAPSEMAQTRTKENTVKFENDAVTDANASVQHFGEMMEAFEKGKRDEAIQQLQTGINALANEGLHLQGEDKTRLNKAIRKLEFLKVKMKKGEITEVDSLMSSIAEAENDVPHKLLIGYDTYEVRPEKQQ